MIRWVTKQSPLFKIGALQCIGPTNGWSPQMIKGRLQLFQEQLFFSLEAERDDDFKQYDQSIRILQQFQSAPLSTFSFYQMFEKIAEEDWIQTTTSMEDLNVLFNLQFQIPVILLNGTSHTLTNKEIERWLQQATPSLKEGQQDVTYLFCFPPTTDSTTIEDRLQRAAQFFNQIHGGEQRVTLL